jgi:hypothetical protein
MNMHTGFLHGRPVATWREDWTRARIFSKSFLRGVLAFATLVILFGSLAAMFWPHASYLTCAVASFLFFTSPFAMFALFLLIG